MNYEPNFDIHAEAVRMGLEIDHHASDLYIKHSPAAVELVQRIRKLYSPPKVSQFTDPAGALWFEVPFAYTPFWTTKAEASA